MQNFSLLQNWWQIPLLAVVSYLIGCFNFALLISRRKKRDITKIGSGNPGTMNMSREFGLKVGLLTFFCDALKGAVPCVIAYFLYRNFVFTGTVIAVSDISRYFCGLFVVIGHIFPVTMRFKYIACKTWYEIRTSCVFARWEMSFDSGFSHYQSKY